MLLVNDLDEMIDLLFESFAEPGVNLIVIIFKVLQIVKLYNLNVVYDEFFDLLIHRFDGTRVVDVTLEDVKRYVIGIALYLVHVVVKDVAHFDHEQPVLLLDLLEHAGLLREQVLVLLEPLLHHQVRFELHLVQQLLPIVELVRNGIF